MNRVSWRFLILTLVIGLSLTTSPQAWGAKTGSACKKLNAKSWDGENPIVCKNSKVGKLVWTKFKSSSNTSSRPSSKRTYQGFNSCFDMAYVPPLDSNFSESVEMIKRKDAWEYCQKDMPTEAEHKMIPKSNSNFNACLRARTRTDFIDTRAEAKSFCWNLQN